MDTNKAATPGQPIKRAEGWYWVKFRGRWAIAEYTVYEEDADELPDWTFCGLKDQYWNDSEFDEIIETPIEPPEKCE